MGQFRHALDSMFDRRGTIVMGILNVTPDSFYAGSRWQGEAAMRQFDDLVTQGAAMIDIGGESTRPGAASVCSQEQIARVAPVLHHAVQAARGKILVSIDTTDPSVATFALDLGVDAINDVSCLANPELAAVAARHRAGLIITHARGPMCEMTGYSQVPDAAYGDIVHDVGIEWGVARDRAIAQGVPRDDIVFDPGLGFWKNARHSIEALRRLREFQSLDAPVMVGASRKSFLMRAGAVPPERRLGASIAAAVHAASAGAHIVRVHDVAETCEALALQRLLCCSALEPSQVGVQPLGATC